MESLIKQLDLLQSKCIGLFKNKYTKSFELVINDKDGVISTISLGELGGVISSNYSIITNIGELKLFPNNRSLLSMKEDIYTLDEFCKSFQ